MTIPNSNFGMNNIRGEYGGDRPDAVSEYYRNGVHVKNWGGSQNIPTDGTIAWSSFRNQAATSGLDSDAEMQYIWDNKTSLFRISNMGASGTTVGNRQVSFLYPFGSYLRGGEPNGNVSWARNAKGSGNGIADFNSARNLVYLGPTTTFLYFSSGYGVGTPSVANPAGWSILTAFDKDNNQVQLDEIYNTQTSGRRELRVLRCNSTDYTNFGCFVASLGSASTIRPTFAAVYMLPGKWDVWSSELIPVTAPGSSPTYYEIETPPNGISIFQGGPIDIDGAETSFLNSTTPNPSGNPTPTEANSRKYIKMQQWFYRNLCACIIVGTGGYETTTWKHRIGSTYYRPWASITEGTTLIKIYKSGS
jgi:hypothetical protein